MSIIATAKQTIKDYSDVMPFGKYRGKTVEWIAEHDPAYILWLVENDIVLCDQEIYEAAMIDDANNGPPEEWFWQPD